MDLRGNAVLKTEIGVTSYKNCYMEEYFCFLEEPGEKENNILFRIVSEDELDHFDNSPDVIIENNGTEYKAFVISTKLKTLDEVSIWLKHNKIAEEMMMKFMSEQENNSVAAAEENKEPEEPHAVAYSYLFNYFGNDTYKGEKVTGAAIDIAIRFFKDGKEILFKKQAPSVKVKSKSELFGERITTIYASELIDVSFDRKKLFNIEPQLEKLMLYKEKIGCDDITCEVVSFNLDVLDKNFQFVSEPQKVAEEDFREFLQRNVDEFDIRDNVHAQCPSVEYISPKQ